MKKTDENGYRKEINRSSFSSAFFDKRDWWSEECKKYGVKNYWVIKKNKKKKS